MDASPLARRVIFGVIVCALAALGAYVLGPVLHHTNVAGGARPAATATPPTARAQPAAPTPGATPGLAGIYQWLPFTQTGLAAAASIVVRFGDAYGTYSYSETGPAYVAHLQTITSSQLVGQIESAYEAPGVAAARQTSKQNAVGSATIGSIRAFGPGSLTFVVQVVQQLTSASGHSQQVTDYAVTVSGSGASWRVSDVELADAGNS